MKLPLLPETALALNVVMSGLAAVPSPQLMVPEKLLAEAVRSVSVKVALRLAACRPRCRRCADCARRQGGVGHRGRAGVGGAAAAGVVDDHGDGIRPGHGVLVTAADGETAAAARNGACAERGDVGVGGGAVAPVDGPREVAGRSSRVGVREGGAQAGRVPTRDTARGTDRARRQEGVGHRGRAGVSGAVAAGVVDDHGDGVGPRRGVRVTAADGEVAAAARNGAALNVVMSGLAAVPSPQLIVPEKLLAGAAALASVKVALRLVELPPSTPPCALTVPAVWRASATVVEPVSVVLPPPVSLMTTVMVEIPPRRTGDCC